MQHYYVTAALILLSLLLLGCKTVEDYVMLEDTAPMSGYVDKKVCLVGEVSEIPWQHMIAFVEGHPYSEYFDVKDYQIVQIAFNRLGHASLSEHLAHLYRPYVILPTFAHRGQSASARKSAERLNKLGEDIRTVQEFPGDGGVLVNYMQPVPRGSPTFRIGRLESAEP